MRLGKKNIDNGYIWIIIIVLFGLFGMFAQLIPSRSKATYVFYVFNSNLNNLPITLNDTPITKLHHDTPDGYADSYYITKSINTCNIKIFEDSKVALEQTINPGTYIINLNNKLHVSCDEFFYTRDYGQYTNTTPPKYLIHTGPLGFGIHKILDITKCIVIPADRVPMKSIKSKNNDSFPLSTRWFQIKFTKTLDQ